MKFSFRKIYFNYVDWFDLSKISQTCTIVTKFGKNKHKHKKIRETYLPTIAEV